MPRQVHLVVVKPPSPQHRRKMAGVAVAASVQHVHQMAECASGEQNMHVFKHEVTADSDLQNLMILANTSETTSNSSQEIHGTVTTQGSSAPEIVQTEAAPTRYIYEHEMGGLSSIVHPVSGATVVIQQTSEADHATESVTVLQEVPQHVEHTETIIIKHDDDMTNTATLQLLSPIRIMPASLPLMASQIPVEIPAETYNKWFGVSSEHDDTTTTATQHAVLQRVSASNPDVAMATQQDVIITRKMTSILKKVASGKGAPRYTGEKKFRCDICGRMFPSTSNLTRHRRLHTGERPYHCRYCSRDFIQRDHLKRHLAVEHTGTFNHQCPVCGKKFQERCRLATHMHNHTGNKPFPCPLCDKAFSTQTALDGHKHWHTGVRNFECEFCLKKFVAYPGLSAHRKIHTGDRRHKCQYCGKTFIARKDCISHERLHTGDLPFECTVCKKRYPRSTALTQHMKTHSDVRPFPCKFCSKSFRQKPALKNHVMIHLDSWPFKCDFCFKKFRRKDSFIAHTARHTGEMPFKCSLCPKAFAQRKVLRQHNQWHKKKGSVLDIEIDETQMNPSVINTPEETWDKAGATVLTNTVNYAIAIHQYASLSAPTDTQPASLSTPTDMQPASSSTPTDTQHASSSTDTQPASSSTPTDTQPVSSLTPTDTQPAQDMPEENWDVTIIEDDDDSRVEIEETVNNISDPTSTEDGMANNTINPTPNHSSRMKQVKGKKHKLVKCNNKISADQNIVHKLLSKSALAAIQVKLNKALSKSAEDSLCASATEDDPQSRLSGDLTMQVDSHTMLTGDVAVEAESHDSVLYDVGDAEVQMRTEELGKTEHEHTRLSDDAVREDNPPAILSDEVDSQTILNHAIAKDVDRHSRLSDNSASDDDPCATLDPHTMTDNDLSRFEIKYLEVVNEVEHSADVFNREQSYISVDVLPVKPRKASRRKSV